MRICRCFYGWWRKEGVVGSVTACSFKTCTLNPIIWWLHYEAIGTVISCNWILQQHSKIMDHNVILYFIIIYGIHFLCFTFNIYKFVNIYNSRRDQLTSTLCGKKRQKMQMHVSSGASFTCIFQYVFNFWKFPVKWDLFYFACFERKCIFLAYFTKHLHILPIWPIFCILFYFFPPFFFNCKIGCRLSLSKNK